MEGKSDCKGVNQALPKEIREALSHEESAWKRGIFDELERSESVDDMIHISSLIHSFFDLNFWFTSEEKARIVSYLYKAITSPQCGCDAQKALISACNRVIRDKETLPLNVPWEPLFEMLDAASNKLYRNPSSEGSRTDGGLWGFCRKISRYFPEGSGEAIMQVLRPRLYSKDCNVVDFAYWMCPPSAYVAPCTGPKLLDEFIALLRWKSDVQADAHLFAFIGGLLQEPRHPGCVDLEPYMGFLFARILANLGLPPAGSSNPRDNGSCENNAQLAGKCVASLITPSSSALTQLERLLDVAEPYFHPLSSGYWTGLLANFLCSFCEGFSNRAVGELKDPKCRTPEEHRFTQDQREAIVRTVLPLLNMLLHSRGGHSQSVVGAVRSLVLVAPVLVFPFFMGKIFESLTSPTGNQRMLASLSILSWCSRFLVMRAHYSDGARVLPDLLQTTLPGVDVNDIFKTMLVWAAYKELLFSMPLLPMRQGDEMDEPPLSTEQLQDWALELLSRLLSVISEGDSAGKKSRERQWISSEVSSFLQMFFGQMDDDLLRMCTDKVRRFLEGHFSMQTLHTVKRVVSTLVAANPSLVLSALFPHVYGRLVSDNGTLKDLTDNEVCHLLTLVRALCRSCGEHLLPYLPKLKLVLSLTVDHKETDIAKHAAKLLKSIVKSLGTFYYTETRCVSPAVWQSAEYRANHWTKWGELVSAAELQRGHHMPSEAEIRTCVELLNECWDRVEPKIRAALSDTAGSWSATQRQDFQKSVHSLLVLVRATAPLLPEITDHVSVPGSAHVLDPKRFPVTTMFTVIQSLHSSALSSLRFSRVSLSSLLHDTMQYLLSSRPGLTKVTGLAAKAVRALLAFRQRVVRFDASPRGVDKRLKPWVRFGPFFKKAATRARMAGKLDHALDTRNLIYLDTLPLSAPSITLLDDLLQMSLSPFRDARGKAQKQLNTAAGVFYQNPWEAIVPKLLSKLTSPDSRPHEIHGALDLLSQDSTIKLVAQRWGLLSLFIRTVSRTQALEASVHPTEDGAAPVGERISSLAGQVQHEIRWLPFGSSVFQEPTEEQKAPYLSLLQDMHSTLSSSTHWALQARTTSFIEKLLRTDTLIPVPLALWIVRGAASKVPKLRDSCTAMCPSLFRLFKPKLPRAEMPPPATTSMETDATDPTSESEWRSADFKDKNYYGWIQLPAKSKAYRQDQAPAFSPDAAAFRDGLLALVREGAFLNELFDSVLTSRLHRYDRQARLSGMLEVHWWKGFVQTLQSEFLVAFGPQIDKLIAAATTGEHEQRASVAILGEIIGGLIRGMRHWPFSAVQATVTHITQMLDRILPLCTIENVGDLSVVLGCSLVNLDPRRFKWLKQYVLAFRPPSAETVHVYLPLELMKEISNSFGWRDTSFASDVVARCLPLAAYHSDLIRDSLAVLLANVHAMTWRPAVDPSTNNVIFGAESLPLPSFLESAIDSLISEGMGLARPASTPDERAKRHADLCTELTKQAISVRFWASVPLLCKTLAVVLLVGSSPDKELSNYGKECMKLVATGATHSLADFRALSGALVQSLTTSTSWKAKELALFSLRFLYSRHNFYVDRSQKDMLDLALPLLQAPQIEIREAAANAITSFVRLTSEEEQNKLIRKFMKMAGSSSKSKQKRSVEEMLVCHGGVLGLSAVALSAPYDVPSWLPSVCESLAPFASFESPIKDTVKKCFSEFWRTHRGEWQEHKEKFTEDQVTMLTEMASSTNYYV